MGGAEGPSLTAWAAEKLPASMGPRLGGRGRVANPLADVATAIVLQWGRALGGAEGQRNMTQDGKRV